MDKIPQPTVGDVLKEEFMIPLKLSVQDVSEGSGIYVQALYEMLANKKRMNAKYAIGLGKYFGNSPTFWLNLQNWYDLRMLGYEGENKK